MSIHVSYNQPDNEIHSYDGKPSAVVTGAGPAVIEIHMTAGEWDAANRLYYGQEATGVDGFVQASENNNQQFLLPCAYLASGELQIALNNPEQGLTTNLMKISITKMSSSGDLSDDDPQFTIDGKKRLVLVPDSQGILAVQFDNESESVTFKFPRYQDGVDLSTKTPFVNYRLPTSGELGKSLCSIDTDMLTAEYIYFSWTIDINVTMYEGSIKFQVEFSDSQGYRWQSQIAELPILTSLYNTGLEPYTPDVLERYLRMIQQYAQDAAESAHEGASQVTLIQQKGAEVLASIPSDYTQLDRDVDNLKSTISTTNQIVELSAAIQIPFAIGKEGAYVNSTGTISNRNGYNVTDYIPFGQFTQVKYKRGGSVESSAQYIATYDANKNPMRAVRWLSKQSNEGYANNLALITQQPGEMYIRFTTYADTLQFGQFELYGSGNPLLTKVNTIDAVTQKIGETSVPVGARSAGYYTGNVKEVIEYTSHGSSSAYTIDLRDYIGQTVVVTLTTTGTSSSRIIALCDSSDVISAEYIEKDIAMGMYPNGCMFYPTATNYKLYISYSPYGSNLSVKALSGMSADITTIKAVIYPRVRFVDGGVQTSGDGSSSAPYKTIAEGIASGAEVLRVKAGEYPAFEVKNRTNPLKIMLWSMPDTYSPATPGVPKIKLTSKDDYGVLVMNCNDIYMSDIWADGQNRHLFRFDGVRRAELVKCYASNNTTEGFCGFSCVNSNIKFIGCEAWNIQLDGFNFHAYGNYDLYDCIAYSCGDDGVSHHDGCTGTIHGGEFHNNGKGGVSSPTFGSTVNIYDVYTHNNSQYGIMVRSNSSTGSVKCKIANCVAKNNATTDIDIKYGAVTGWNNIYDTKSVDVYSTFTEY